MSRYHLGKGRLKSSQYKLLDERMDSDRVLQAYQPVGAPLVLFNSKSGKPLASIRLKTHEDTAGAVITRRPQGTADTCDFQGLVGHENQEIELIITNLCSDYHVQFNVFRTTVFAPHGDQPRELETSSQSVNEVNELRPNESYAIRCDQEDNRTLILSAIKDTVTGSRITVGEAESASRQSNTAAKGTYFYLNVVPENTTKAKADFEETAWSTADILVRPVKKRKQKFRRLFKRKARAGDFREVSNSAVATLYNAPRGRGGGRGGGRRGGRRGSLDDRGDRGTIYLAPRSRSRSPTRRISGSDEEDDSSSSLERCSYSSPSRERCRKRRSTSERRMVTDEDLIMTSHAARLESGREIKVLAVETDTDYAYDTTSTPCVLGLSVSPSLQLLNVGVLGDTVAKRFEEYIAKSYLPTTRVFKQTECAICLDDEPNVVFLQCGHMCLHADCDSACMVQCPLCRQHIHARMPLAAFPA